MSKSGLTLVLHISYLRAFMKDTLKNHMDADDRWGRGEEEEEEEEEEEGLFKADAVNEEDPERDRATQV